MRTPGFLLRTIFRDGRTIDGTTCTTFADVLKTMLSLSKSECLW
jgi:hypothetical protein